MRPCSLNQTWVHRTEHEGVFEGEKKQPKK